ncbi:hypothetical protein QDZ90_005048, partial [Pluralibacter gergoviae]
MSRTTTVDNVPTADVSDTETSPVGRSGVQPFIKRGTPQFIRVT